MLPDYELHIRTIVIKIVQWWNIYRLIAYNENL